MHGSDTENAAASRKLQQICKRIVATAIGTQREAPEAIPVKSGTKL